MRAAPVGEYLRPETEHEVALGPRRRLVRTPRHLGRRVHATEDTLDPLLRRRSQAVVVDERVRQADAVPLVRLLVARRRRPLPGTRGRVVEAHLQGVAHRRRGFVFVGVGGVVLAAVRPRRRAVSLNVRRARHVPDRATTRAGLVGVGTEPTRAQREPRRFERRAVMIHQLRQRGDSLPPLDVVLVVRVVHEEEGALAGAVRVDVDVKLQRVRVAVGVLSRERHRVSQRGILLDLLLRRLVLRERARPDPVALANIRVSPRAVEVHAHGIRPVITQRAPVRVQHRHDDERDPLAELHGGGRIARYEIDEAAEGVRARRLPRVHPARDHHDGSAAAIAGDGGGGRFRAFRGVSPRLGCCIRGGGGVAHVVADRQNVASPVLQRSAQQLALDVRQPAPLQRVEKVLLHGVPERVAVREPVRFFALERVNDRQDARRLFTGLSILGAVPPVVFHGGVVPLLRRAVLLFVVEDALGVYPLPRRARGRPHERAHPVAVQRLRLGEVHHVDQHPLPGARVRHLEVEPEPVPRVVRVVPHGELVFVVRDATHVPEVASLEVGGELRRWRRRGRGGKGKTARRESDPASEWERAGSRNGRRASGVFSRARARLRASRSPAARRAAGRRCSRRPAPWSPSPGPPTVPAPAGRNG